MSWLLHLAAGLLCLASLHITQATVVSNRHAHLDCNGYFYTHTHIRTHSHTRTLQKDSHRPPNIPHQQASTLNVAPHSLLECWEVYMDIIATLCATLTTSEAHPVDLLSNAPQQIKGGGGAVRGELAGSGISLDVMMMINQEPYNMTADSALLVAFWMNRNASVDRYAIINAVFLSICIGVATWGQRRAASMLHDVDFKTVNKFLTRDALLNVQNAHIWQQGKSISGLNF